MIALQLKDPSAALPLIGHAIELDPKQPIYFNNLGNALFEENHLDDAETMYRRAIELQPDYAEAVYNFGNTLQILQRYDEALTRYEQAVALKPGTPTRCSVLQACSRRAETMRPHATGTGACWRWIRTTPMRTCIWGGVCLKKAMWRKVSRCIRNTGGNGA